MRLFSVKKTTMLPKITIKKLLKENETHYCPPMSFGGICVKIVAIARLPSRFGNFQVVAFYNDKDKKEHAAFVKGDPTGKTNVPTRIHYRVSYRRCYRFAAL